MILLEQGYSYDTIDAVLAAGDERIYSLERKVEALSAFRGDVLFADLITGFERVANLAAKGAGRNWNRAPSSLRMRLSAKLCRPRQRTAGPWWIREITRASAPLSGAAGSD